MTTIAIRQKLADYIKVADDQKLMAVYTLLKDDMTERGRLSIAEYNKEIDIAVDEVTKGKVRKHRDVIIASKKW